MASNYSKFLYNDYEKLLEKFEKKEQLLKENNEIIKTLNATIKSMQEIIEILQKVNEEQAKKILILKSNNDKDSNNSRKLSSTNGFKKVIINRREKSYKPKGGQKFHKPHSLTNKLEQFIKSGNVKEEIIEVNKNEQNKRYIKKVVIDIEITILVKRYRYYPNEDGKYNIPKVHNQKATYGTTVKAIAIDLMNNLYNSTDDATRFINDITNGGITLSK